MESVLWLLPHVPTVIAAAVVAFFASYLREKGKNTATKEDIRRITQDVESVKAQHAADLETVRSALHRASVEHSGRFTKLHEKRAEVLAKLNRLLVAALWATENASSPMQWVGASSKVDQSVAAQNAIAAAYRFFDKHRVYLPASLCTSLDAFMRELRGPMIKLQVFYEIDSPNEETRRELRQHSIGSKTRSPKCAVQSKWSSANYSGR